MDFFPTSFIVSLNNYWEADALLINWSKVRGRKKLLLICFLEIVWKVDKKMRTDSFNHYIWKKIFFLHWNCPICELYIGLSKKFLKDLKIYQTKLYFFYQCATTILAWYFIKVRCPNTFATPLLFISCSNSFWFCVSPLTERVFLL